LKPIDPIQINRILVQALCGEEAAWELCMKVLFSLSFDFRGFEQWLSTAAKVGLQHGF